MKTRIIGSILVIIVLLGIAIATNESQPSRPVPSSTVSNTNDDLKNLKIQ